MKKLGLILLSMVLTIQLASCTAATEQEKVFDSIKKLSTLNNYEEITKIKVGIQAKNLPQSINKVVGDFINKMTASPIECDTKVKRNGSDFAYRSGTSFKILNSNFGTVLTNKSYKEDGEQTILSFNNDKNTYYAFDKKQSGNNLLSGMMNSLCELKSLDLKDVINDTLLLSDNANIKVDFLSHQGSERININNKYINTDVYEIKLDNAKFKNFITAYSGMKELNLGTMKNISNIFKLIGQPDIGNTLEQLPDLKASQYLKGLSGKSFFGNKGVSIKLYIDDEGYLVKCEGGIDILSQNITLSKLTGSLKIIPSSFLSTKISASIYLAVDNIYNRNTTFDINYPKSEQINTTKKGFGDYLIGKLAESTIGNAKDMVISNILTNKKKILSIKKSQVKSVSGVKYVEISNIDKVGGKYKSVLGVTTLWINNKIGVIKEKSKSINIDGKNTNLTKLGLITTNNKKYISYQVLSLMGVQVNEVN